MLFKAGCENFSLRNLRAEIPAKSHIGQWLQHAIRNNGGKGKGHQGTCIKSTWTKPKGGGWQGWLGWGRAGGEIETTVLEQQ